MSNVVTDSEKDNITYETHPSRRKFVNIAGLPLRGEYQRAACGWMIEKELRREESREKEEVSGGILADEVGLGKTYMMAGVLMGNPLKCTLIVTLTNIQLQWSKVLTDFSKAADLKDPRVELRCFKLPDKCSDLSEIMSTEDANDDSVQICVFTTYQQVRNRPQWMMSTKWDRVVLDEGHYIRNPKTSTFEAVKRLNAQHRWVLSATPIHNSIRDMLTLLDWIGLDVKRLTTKKRGRKKGSKNGAKKAAIPPVELGMVVDPHIHIHEILNTEDDLEIGEQGESDLTKMISSNVLRRTMKSESWNNQSLRLPDLINEEREITWCTDFERKLYDSLVTNINGRLLAQQSERTRSAKRNTSRDITIEGIMRLRQICVSYEIYEKSINKVFTKEREDYEDNEELENDDDFKESMAQDKTDNEFFFRTMTELDVSDAEVEKKRVRTDTKERLDNDNTPMSNIPFKLLIEDEDTDDENRVLNTTTTEVDENVTDHRYVNGGGVGGGLHVGGHSFNMMMLENPMADITRIATESKDRPKLSSKMQYLCERLRMDFERDDDSKVVIFTTFLEEMSIIQRELDKLNIDSCKLHGAMNIMQRDDVLQLFADKNSGVKVLIAQIVCSSTGLNLQYANIVYITSPTWNPCTETQAIGRVQRQGQTRTVRVVRLIMKDTIEQECLNTQKRKRKLIDRRLPCPPPPPPPSLSMKLDLFSDRSARPHTCDP